MQQAPCAFLSLWAYWSGKPKEKEGAKQEECDSSLRMVSGLMSWLVIGAVSYWNACDISWSFCRVGCFNHSMWEPESSYPARPKPFVRIWTSACQKRMVHKLLSSRELLVLSSEAVGHDKSSRPSANALCIRCCPGPLPSPACACCMFTFHAKGWPDWRVHHDIMTKCTAIIDIMLTWQNCCNVLPFYCSCL